MQLGSFCSFYWRYQLSLISAELSQLSARGDAKRNLWPLTTRRHSCLLMIFLLAKTSLQGTYRGRRGLPTSQLAGKILALSDKYKPLHVNWKQKKNGAKIAFYDLPGARGPPCKQPLSYTWEKEHTSNPLGGVTRSENALRKVYNDDFFENWKIDMAVLRRL